MKILILELIINHFLYCTQKKKLRESSNLKIGTLKSMNKKYIKMMIYFIQDNKIGIYLLKFTSGYKNYEFNY